MKNHFFAMLSRMKNIYRWGLMRNTKKESLSEHSLEVAFIAHALAVIKNTRFGGNVNPETAATVALFHDTPEIITGDMPTPVKYYNSEIRNAYKEIESVAEKSLIEMLPEDMKEVYKKIYNNDDAEIKIIVKAADKISALIKCIEETNSGNKEFAKAKISTEKAVHELEYEPAEVFLKEFIPSYSLTLDQSVL